MDFFQFASYAEFFVNFTIDANGEVANKFWICLLVGGLCFLIVYVFQVMGLYAIAKREGFGKKWMIFVPFVNTYYIGVCSEKNKVYSLNSKYFALATAILEGILVAGYILYYVAVFQVWDYIIWEPQYYSNGTLAYYSPSGFYDTMPSSMDWLGWIFMNASDFIFSWLELIFVILKLLLLTAFFRTYAARQYLLFSIVGALLPLQGILIFAVRNNKGMNYMDYIKMVRERNYRMYQQQYGNPYNQNPYNNPYGGQYGAPSSGGSSRQEPFDEYGNRGSSGENNSSSDKNGSSGSGGDSPFDEFN